MKRNYKLTVLITAITILLSAAALAGGTKLVYKYKKGDAFSYKWTQKQTIIMKGMPQQAMENAPGGSADSMKIEMESVGSLKYDVGETEGKTASMKISFSDFKTKTSVPDAPTGDIDNMVKGMSFGMKTDQTGKVLSFDTTGMPQDVPNDFIESMRNSLNQGQALFPDKEVNVGDKWDGAFNTSINMPMGGSAGIKTSVIYKVKKFDKYNGKKAVYLEETATTKIEAPSDPATGKPIMTGEGKFTGEVIFLIDEGRMAKQTMKGEQTLKISMQIGVAKNAPQMADMTQTILLESNMELK